MKAIVGGAAADDDEKRLHLPAEAAQGTQRELTAEVEVMTPDYYDTYNKMLNKRNIHSANEMQMQYGKHYMITDDNAKMVAGMSVVTAAFGNASRICCSVELMVSIQKGKAALLLHMLQSNLKKRRGTCYMITQAAETPSACGFWNKHLSLHREAMALNFMFFMLDSRFELCDGVSYFRAKF